MSLSGESDVVMRNFSPLCFVSYGKSVVKAMNDAGLGIAISAPSAEAPSVARAVELYLEQNS